MSKPLPTKSTAGDQSIVKVPAPVGSGSLTLEGLLETARRATMTPEQKWGRAVSPADPRPTRSVGSVDKTQDTPRNPYRSEELVRAYWTGYHDAKYGEPFNALKLHPKRRRAYTRGFMEGSKGAIRVVE